MNEKKLAFLDKKMEELENETPDELGDVIKENEALAVES